MNYSVEPIAYIRNQYNEKFGIPRQSGLENDTVSDIIFYEKYRDENALRGLKGYSHIWILWIFDKAETNKEWSPTVRPPRLGGNKRMGVFSTRSPFHPNRIGLSCVKIKSIEKNKDNGTIIKVIGADLLNGTPIIDIKPYLSFTDSHPEAKCGFADEVFDNNLKVVIEEGITEVNDETIETIINILRQDPRPSYQSDCNRVYTMNYACYEIKFTVNGNTLTVTEISDRTEVNNEKADNRNCSTR